MRVTGAEAYCDVYNVCRAVFTCVYERDAYMVMCGMRIVEEEEEKRGK